MWKRDYRGESKVAISLVQQTLVVIRSKVVAMDVSKKSDSGQIIKAESKSFTTGFNISIQKSEESRFWARVIKKNKVVTDLRKTVREECLGGEIWESHLGHDKLGAFFQLSK